MLGQLADYSYTGYFSVHFLEPTASQAIALHLYTSNIKVTITDLESHRREEFFHIITNTNDSTRITMIYGRTLSVLTEYFVFKNNLRAGTAFLSISAKLSGSLIRVTLK